MCALNPSGPYLALTTLPQLSGFCAWPGVVWSLESCRKLEVPEVISSYPGVPGEDGGRSFVRHRRMQWWSLLTVLSCRLLIGALLL